MTPEVTISPSRWPYAGWTTYELRCPETGVTANVQYEPDWPADWIASAQREAHATLVRLAADKVMKDGIAAYRALASTPAPARRPFSKRGRA